MASLFGRGFDSLQVHWLNDKKNPLKISGFFFVLICHDLLKCCRFFVGGKQKGAKFIT